LERVAQALARSARHADWQVRRAGASALRELRHESTDEIASLLAGDEHDFVRRAARSLLADRTRRNSADALDEQHEELLRGWLTPLEARYGAAARDAALAVARRYTQLVIDEAIHETRKALHASDLALERIARSLE